MQQKVNKQVDSVAIAARAPFEGVTTFDSYRACALLQKFNHGGMVQH